MNLFLLSILSIYFFKLNFFDEFFKLPNTIGRDFKFLNIKKNLFHNEPSGLVFTVIKCILDISNFIFFKQKSIELYGNTVVCFILVNLSSSTAATNNPFLKIQAEDPE